MISKDKTEVSVAASEEELKKRYKAKTWIIDLLSFLVAYLLAFTWLMLVPGYSFLVVFFIVFYVCYFVGRRKLKSYYLNRQQPG